MNQNICILIGRITKAPEMRATTSGTQIATFGLATNHIYKDKAGQKQETTQFHNCVAFGRTAEIIGQYITKGQEAMVQGRIQYDTYQKKDGTKGYATRIIVENLQMGQKPIGSKQAPSEPIKVSDEDIPVIEETGTAEPQQ
jgi:single-strand DNA-binding protein